jgi:4-carboxymuconolactone decarboxylase
MIKDSHYDAGTELRQAMWGPGAMGQIENATEVTDKLQDIVTRFCFGDVWQRDGLTLRERSLVTVAILIALNREHELRLHMMGALANGATEVELREVSLHSILYAGIPAGVGGVRTLDELLAELRPDSPLRAPAQSDGEREQTA